MLEITIPMHSDFFELREDFLYFIFISGIYI